MGSSFLFLFSIAFVLILSSDNAAAASTPPKPTALHFTVRKDPKTLQYYTAINLGSDRNLHLDAVIDLGAPLLWINCDTSGYNSSTYRPVRCGSAKCKTAGGIGCVGCNGTPRPGCTNDTCGSNAYNPFINRLLAAGLYEDDFVVDWTNGAIIGSSAKARHFPFACADAGNIEGLATSAQGIFGLARTPISTSIQLSQVFNISSKFVICLPSKKPTERVGDIFVGSGPYYMMPYAKDVAKELIKTPLVTNPVSTAPIYSEGDASYEYFIGVKSIKIDGKTVSFKSSLLSFDKEGVGGTKLSTIVPYSLLHTNIYNAFVKDFVKRAVAKKIARVAAVKPFGACFNSKTIRSTVTGPDVPRIDLVLQRSSMHWTIYGRNSMVKVKKDVMCLAFVDGGSNPRTSIVIGGYQLEDNLLEFDLAASELGFSSSLLLKNTSCSPSRLS